MKKETPAREPAKGTDQKPTRRSPRSGAPAPDATPAPPPTTVARRRLAATALNSAGPPSSSARRPPSTGRKQLSALSANKRRLDGSGSEPGSASGKHKTATPQNDAGPSEQATPAMRAGAPPMTVAEAQELGEQARLRDDTMWALEGLSSSAGQARQESLATLVEIYANRRNRLALHTSTLGADFLGGIAKLKVADDPVLALGAAAVLLLSTQPGGDPAVLASPEIAKLAAAVLEASGSVPTSGVPAPAVRVLRVLHEASVAKVLPREASFSPSSVALAALGVALDPHAATAATEAIKHALRGAGALRAVAQLGADHSQALVDPSPTMETVQSLWKLERALVVLEHACFACAENEAALVGMQVTQGVAPMLARMSLCQWLVAQMQAIVRQAVIAGLKKDCLRGVLAVLMNVTHNNPAGCERVIAGSGIETACLALARICLGGGAARGVLQSGDELRAWMDELNGCLGLLINCAEENKAVCSKMRTLQLPTAAEGSADGLVGMLSRLISTVTAAIAPEPAKEQDDGHAEEVTLDALQHGEGEAAASIVEVYAAILLGFLVEGDKEAQKIAAELLPGKSLAPVVSAVQKCLHFYVSAGAITQRTETSLRALLASLQADVGSN